MLRESYLYYRIRYVTFVMATSQTFYPFLFLSTPTLVNSLPLMGLKLISQQLNSISVALERLDTTRSSVLSCAERVPREEKPGLEQLVVLPWWERVFEKKCS